MKFTVYLLTVVCIVLSLPETSAKQVKDAKYYQLLEVATSVSDADLRKAYHKLALKWHPDKHAKKSVEERAEAEKKFKDISLAYDTLSDPRKRKLYDQVGEEGMKRGDKGGNEGGFQTGGIDPFNIFEQFFKGFGGGGGFSFDIGGFNMGGFNMGGHSEGPRGLFGDSPEEVETLQNLDRLKELIAQSASEVDPFLKQFVVILCTESNGDCKSLKNGLVKMAKSNKEAVAFYAADCIRQPNLCRVVESDVQRYPCIVYYGYNRRVPYDHGPEKISARTVRLWLANLVPDKLVYIKTARTGQEIFMENAERGKATVVYLTEKLIVPPKLKALSMEFQGRITVAVLSRKDSPEVFALFGNTPRSGQTVPEELPVLYNVQTGEFVRKAGSEYHEYFVSLAAGAQKTLFQELTPDLYDSGVCNVTDYRFCLLALFPSTAELESEQKRGNLLSISEEYSSELSDPLRVVFVLRDKTPEQHPRLWTMLCQLSPAWNTMSSGAILWRPRWRRFDTFSGDLADGGALRSFVRSAFMRAALDGDRGLSVEHPEF